MKGLMQKTREAPRIKAEYPSGTGETIIEM